MRRWLCLVVATAAGCANTYKIPGTELARLAAIPPEQRGQHVRVIQDWNESRVPAAHPVTAETQIIIVPDIEVGGGVTYTRPGAGGRYNGGGFHIGNGSNSKNEAIAYLVLAGVALVSVAAVESSRFDGWAALHPMEPVHLIGKDGGYAVMPLAWIDPQTAAWADYAVIRSTEGPLRELERARLDRQGWTYAMYGGTGTYVSKAGELGAGPAFTVQLGGYFTPDVGLVASVFAGWRDNRVEGTLFESRYMLELQALPVHLGLFSAGVYGGAGFADRLEDSIPGGDNISLALAGGAMFQLELDTRIALTARMGISRDHDVQMHDILVGISVF
jgi:hypothetical protein